VIAAEPVENLPQKAIIHLKRDNLGEQRLGNLKKNQVQSTDFWIIEQKSCISKSLGSFLQHNLFRFVELSHWYNVVLSSKQILLDFFQSTKRILLTADYTKIVDVKKFCGFDLLRAVR
jgi:hypothetical protein